MNDAVEKLIKKMLEAITQKSFLEEIGKYTVNRVVTRTRLGNGVKENGAPTEKLKPLSTEYIERRKRLMSSSKLERAKQTAQKQADERIRKEENGEKVSNRKSAADKYIERYAKAKRDGSTILSDLTTPSRSNLTKTGSMLNAVYYEIVAPNRLEIKVKGDAEIEKVKRNKGYGRTFLHVTDKDLKELKTITIKAIVEALKK